MAIVRPAITGDIIQDSWADQVTKALNNATLSGGTGGIGGTGSGTGPPGVDGFNTATIYLFRRTLTDTAPDTIAVSTTYTYETGVLEDDDNGNTGDPSIPDDDITGWYRAIPDEVDGGYVWTIQVSVADQEGSDTISAATWSAVTLLSRPGDAASAMLIQAFAEDPDSPLTLDWTAIPPQGVMQVSPNFKNDTSQVIGLVARIFEGGNELTAARYNAATYQWSKNGIDFVQNPDLAAPGTGGTERIILINEMDIREGNFNEVFNCSADY